jgi:hypothetical protein
VERAVRKLKVISFAILLAVLMSGCEINHDWPNQLYNRGEDNPHRKTNQGDVSE